MIRGRSSGLNRSAARKFAVPIEAVSRTAGVKYGRVSLSYKLEELLKSYFGAVIEEPDWTAVWSGSLRFNTK